MENFEVIVIGGGPGGYLAAERAGHAGLKTAVFEKRALGGVCLNEGCIPSKSLLYSAKVLEYAKHAAAYGVKVPAGAEVDQNAVIDRKNGVVKTLVSGVGAKMKANHVTVVKSEATITGKTAEGFTVTADGKDYCARKLIIASGSEAIVPPIPGVRENYPGFILTNREILDLREVPKKLAIVGGGVIGLEMASYYNRVGSDVTVIEMMNKIAGPTDNEVSTILQKNYAKKGVSFKLGCKVTGVTKGSVSYQTPDGKDETLECDYCLLSIGRRPNTNGLGLETIGVYTERGAIVTDENLRTNVPGVYAIGDVNGKMMLAHTAYREAEVAVNHILGKRDVMRYNAIPSVIYTTPEVGAVGETEETAKAKGINVKTAKVTMNYSGRYLAENNGGDGICKLIVDASRDRLIGVHMIGSYCSEMIYGAAMMIETEMRIDDIKEIVFPHPTVCEVIREALFEL